METETEIEIDTYNGINEWVKGEWAEKECQREINFYVHFVAMIQSYPLVIIN